MKSKKLNEAFQYIDDKYLDKVESEKRRKKPVWLYGSIIAASICLIVIIPVGVVAADWFGLRSLLLPEATGEVFQNTDIQEDEVASQTDIIGLSGYMDSPERQALNEWQIFLDDYDQDGSIIAAIGNNPTNLDSRYGLYYVYTQEMGDKLDEIVAKYNLKLHTEINTVSPEELVYRVGEFLQGEAFWGYIYEDGSFQYDGDIVLDSGVIESYQFRRVVKGTFDEVVLDINHVEDYQEIQYITAGGEPVMLALGPDKALIYADFEECFITLNVLSGSAQGTSEADIKEIADAIDFTVLKAVQTPEMRGDSIAQAATGGNQILEQTFNMDLRPLGSVTFAPYEPDVSRNPLADVVLKIEKDGEVLMQLPGTTANNTNSEKFAGVQVVNFVDYNYDSCDDIILIINYYQGAETHATIRYYKGSASGEFSYEAQMSADATSALSEITMETAKEFVGYKDVVMMPWQLEYISYIEQYSDVENQAGYALIMMKGDGVLQLVEVGADNATGCKIIYCGNDDEFRITQLNRLNFTYIPGENLLCNSDGLMDSYYDLIYSIIDGDMKGVAVGYYGAEDNSNVQFDSKGDPIYQYEWNGVKMSKAEYERELRRVYDTTQAVAGYDYDNLYSADEMIEVIKGYSHITD